MDTVGMGSVRLKDVVSMHVVESFPQGMTPPLANLIRMAYGSHRDEIYAGTMRFEFPGMGTLTMHERNYTFEPTEAYRKNREGRELMQWKGRWG